MTLSLSEIHEFEIREDYPTAINKLEAHLEENPTGPETVIRLGFNLWYTVIENDRIGKNLPTEDYASRFMALFHTYRERFWKNADFCWAFGKGINLFWYHFPGATEELGQTLIDRASELDPFYERFWSDLPPCAVRDRFKGRGILALYYDVA